MKLLKNQKALSANRIFFGGLMTVIGILLAISACAADTNTLPRYDGRTREEFRENMKESVKEMKRFSDDFQRFITDIKEATKETGWNNFDTNTTPSLGSADVLNEKEQMTIYVDLPGVNKEDIAVQLIDDQTLSIQAKRQAPSNGKESMGLNERYDGRLERIVNLPARADLKKKIKAKLKDGVLNIQIPKIAGQDNQIVRIDVD